MILTGTGHAVVWDYMQAYKWIYDDNFSILIHKPSQVAAWPYQLLYDRLQARDRQRINVIFNSLNYKLKFSFATIMIILNFMAPPLLKTIVERVGRPTFTVTHQQEEVLK